LYGRTVCNWRTTTTGAVADAVNTVAAKEVEAVVSVVVVVDDGVVVPEVVVAGVAVVAPVTATDDGWDEDVVVEVVDDPVVDVVDAVDDVEDVTGATGTATGSSVNTSGLPAAVDVDPEEVGSV